MNEKPTLSWVSKVVGAFPSSRRLLAWDSFECHLMNSVKNAIRKLNVGQVINPGRCTKYAQAPDVCWDKPFKVFVREQYDEWMASRLQQYTEAGNLRPPSRKNIVQWILTAWARLSPEIITNSFKSCGLNLNTDGSRMV